MREITVGKIEEDQRLDRILARLFPNAGKGFVFKMLRKKNIVLNDKKAGGDEVLKAGDSVKFYMTDDTLKKFGAVLAKVPGEASKNKNETIKKTDSKNNKVFYPGYSIKDNIVR